MSICSDSLNSSCQFEPYSDGVSQSVDLPILYCIIMTVTMTSVLLNINAYSDSAKTWYIQENYI